MISTLLWCFLVVFGIILIDTILIEVIYYVKYRRRKVDPVVCNFWRDYSKTRRTIDSCNTLEQFKVSRNMVNLLKLRYTEYTSLSADIEDLYNFIDYKELCLEKPSQN